MESSCQGIYDDGVLVAWDDDGVLVAWDDDEVLRAMEEGLGAMADKDIRHDEAEVVVNCSGGG